MVRRHGGRVSLGGAGQGMGPNTCIKLTAALVELARLWVVGRSRSLHRPLGANAPVIASVLRRQIRSAIHRDST